MIEVMTVTIDGTVTEYQPLLADISDYWDWLEKTKTANNRALGQLFIAYLVGHNNTPPKTKNDLMAWAREKRVHVDLGEPPDPTQTAASPGS